MAQLALAALSARTLVEAALRADYPAVALDVFGDSDTRVAATAWQAIGSSATCQIEPSLFLRSLHRLAASGQARAWIYGSGFEGLADVLQEAQAMLPLWGTAASALRRVRCPAQFFAFLDTLEIPHPEVLFSHCPSGWLHKCAAASGGAHISRATADSPLLDGFYAQREVAGRALSASYLANGVEAVLLGINQQWVQPQAGVDSARPFVFSGVMGPITLAAAAELEIKRALQALTAEFGLRGLGSLDFMLDGEQLWLLEVNPRPSASLPLHDHGDVALLRAHALACQGADLRALQLRPRCPLVHGVQTVFARESLHINKQQAAMMQAAAHVHDRPLVGTWVGSGQPLCSVCASAPQAQTVRAQLNTHAATLLHTLESTP